MHIYPVGLSIGRCLVFSTPYFVCASRELLWHSNISIPGPVGQSVAISTINPGVASLIPPGTIL